MIVQSKLINDFGDFAIWEIGDNRAIEATRFVYEIYYHLFSRKYQWEGDYDKMEADDRETEWDSTIYAALSREGSFLGTIRLIEKGRQFLPIEQDFDIDVLDVCREKKLIPNRIFEVARLAKSPEQLRKAGIAKGRKMALLDELFATAIFNSCQESGNIWVASIDVNVLTLLRSRGFHFSSIGKTEMDYLGSPTTPVILSIDQCREDMRQLTPKRYEKYFGTAVETIPVLS